MIYHLQRMVFGLVIVLCCFMVTALPAEAETDSEQDGWKFGGSVYLWAAGVKGTDAAGDEIDVSFSDTLEDLDGGLMGIIAAQRGKWTLLADIIYLSIHQETSSNTNLIGVPSKIDVDVKLKGFISTFGVSYRIVDNDGTSLDLMAGATPCTRSNRASTSRFARSSRSRRRRCSVPDTTSGRATLPY